MPWKAASAMSLRREFVELARAEGSNFAQLCARFGISRKSGYKWLARYEAGGVSELADRSRRPERSPEQTSAKHEALIIKLRQQHPAWGARKLRVRLEALGHRDLPAASTVHQVLVRHGLINPAESSKHRAFVRFEHEQPNDLWQMDFKGHFGMQAGGRCHPLTVLDDHSRFSVTLAACGDEQGSTVQRNLIAAFQRFGLPQRMLMDNGGSWRATSGEPYSEFTVWLLRLGIGVTHGRPYHPQTQGKEERFHRTLKAEVLCRPLATLDSCQQHFDQWREVYNHERPHEALNMAVPSSRYCASRRPYPAQLPEIEYGPDDHVRRASCEGDISFRGQEIRISKAFRRLPLGLRPTSDDAILEVRFSHLKIGEIHYDQAPDTRGRRPFFVRSAHEERPPASPP